MCDDDLRKRLTKWTVRELRTLSKREGVTGFSNAKKKDLIDRLLEVPDIADKAFPNDDGRAKPRRKEDSFWQKNGWHIIGTAVAISAIIVPIVFTYFQRDPTFNIRVYARSLETDSDIELENHGRSRVFVRVAEMPKDMQRMVIGSLAIRPVNIGEKSINDLSLSMILSEPLWNKSLGEAEESLVTALGQDKIEVEVESIAGGWLSKRNGIRLDPMGGAPFPILFVLEVNSPENGLARQVGGTIEIRATGPDWSGFRHKLEVHCIVSDGETFIDKARTKEEELAVEDKVDVPVYYAETRGAGTVVAEHNLVLVQATVHAFLETSE